MTDPPIPALSAIPATSGVGGGGLLVAIQIRRLRRLAAAVNAWHTGGAPSVWKRRAFEAMGWPVGGPWCAAWAGLIDLEANGGPSALYRKGYSVSCTRRCVWAHKGSGVDPKTGKVARPALGPAYEPRAPESVQPGDIITVGRRVAGGRWARAGGSHCTIAVDVSQTGVWCIGGNQSGRNPAGGRVSASVALTFYPFDAHAVGLTALRVQWVVSIPDAEYPPAGEVDGAALRDALAIIRAATA